MSLGILLLLTVLQPSGALGSSWEPFMAKVRRTVTDLDRSGKVIAVTITEHTYLRSANGSLRHEVYRMVDGKPAQPATTITLHDTSNRQSFTIDVSQKLAVRSAIFGDPEEQYRDSLTTYNRTPREYLGVPCVMLTSRFMEKTNLVSTGSSGLSPSNR